MIRITVAQFSPKLGDKEQNLDKITECFEMASKQSSDILVFPELCLTGALVFDFIDDISEDLDDSPSVKYIQSKCNEFGIHGVFTFVEKIKNREYYNSAVLIDDTGKILGVYRKVHLFADESKSMTSGKDFPVFQTKLGKIAIAICFDLEFPETARILRLNGAEIIIAPTNNMLPYNEDQSIYARSRSKENQIPVVICNRIGKEKDYEFFGESIIVDAFGKPVLVLARNEEIVTVGVNLHATIDNTLGYIAHRQPDLYNKLIEKTSKKAQ